MWYSVASKYLSLGLDRWNLVWCHVDWYGLQGEIDGTWCGTV